MGFGLKRRLVSTLDRPGGRAILAAAVNRLARLRGFKDIKIFYEGRRWFHRVGERTFPGHRHFTQWPYNFAAFASQESRYLNDANDYWMAFFTPPKNGVVIDVGAGEGEDVLAFSRAIGSQGRVIAIEAFPTTFEVLREFCLRNGLTNTITLQAALGDRSGTITFQESTHWVENAIDMEGGSGGVDVRCATLGEICAELNIAEIDYLKMNIEGAEVQALKGMVDVLPRIKAICVSCHDFRADRGDGEQFRTRDFVVPFLRSHGFALKFRDDPRPYVRDQVFGTHISTGECRSIGDSEP
jgi:FkbM family methyltransferase